MNNATATLRRLIVYTLLFILVVLAANGIGGLLARLFTATEVIGSDEASSLALSLALALVGGVLAAVLFWALWRRTSDPAERGSTAWGLYVGVMYLVSLVAASAYILWALSTLAARDLGDWKPSLARGLAWYGVWAWHRWMWGHGTRGPLALANVPPVLGSVLGLAIGTGALVQILGAVFTQVVDGAGKLAAIGNPWWAPLPGLLVWLAGGLGIWWWHWFHDAGRERTVRLANVALVTVGVLAAAVLCLGGAGVLLYVLLRLGLDRTEPLAELLDPLPLAMACALAGALVWIFHAGVTGTRAASTVLAARLAISGAGLAAAASGTGVIVNGLLATATTSLGGSDPATLLLAGLSSLAVGGPVWWRAFGPLAPADPHGRRVYLVVVFGASALAAMVTLLVIGFRLFELLLGQVGSAGLLERVRAPLGVLLATGLVAGYHFALWRHDRAVAPAPAQRMAPAIGEVLLVAGADAQDLAAAIKEHTGATVTLLQRAGAGSTTLQAVLPALEGLVAERVLLLAGPGERVEAIELA